MNSKIFFSLAVSGLVSLSLISTGFAQSTYDVPVTAQAVQTQDAATSQSAGSNVHKTFKKKHSKKKSHIKGHHPHKKLKAGHGKKSKHKNKKKKTASTRSSSVIVNN